MKKITTTTTILFFLIVVPVHAQLLTPGESAACSLEFEKQGSDYVVIDVAPVLTGVTEAQCEGVLADTGNSIGEAITSVTLNTGAESSAAAVLGEIVKGTIHFEYGGTHGEVSLSPTINLFPDTLVELSSESDTAVTGTETETTHRVSLQMRIIELLQKLISLLR